jgi:chromosome segregation ATPase
MSRHLAGLLLSTVLVAVSVSVSAQQPGGDLNPKKAMAQAHADILAGRDKEALTLYEAVLTSQSRDAAKYKADALYGAAILRLSTDTPDLARADSALNELTKSYPAFEHRQEAAAFLRLIQQNRQVEEMNRRTSDEQRASQEAVAAKTAQVAEYQERIANLTDELKAARAEIDGGKRNANNARQDVTALRSENRTLRDQLTNLQAELEKKEKALRKIAGSIGNKSP